MSENKYCYWNAPDNDSCYETTCGNAFYFDSGDVTENGFKWCPYCGKPLEDDTDPSGGKDDE